MRLDDNEGLPKWFVPVAVLGVIWGLISLVFCYQALNVDTEQLLQAVPQGNVTAADLVIAHAQRMAFLEGTPIWAKAAYVGAAISGLMGAIGLLIRRKWSFLVLGLSLICVFCLQVSTWLRGGFDMLEDKALMLSSRDMFIAVATTAIAAALFYLAMRAFEKRWYK